MCALLHIWHFLACHAHQERKMPNAPSIFLWSVCCTVKKAANLLVEFCAMVDTKKAYKRICLQQGSSCESTSAIQLRFWHLLEHAPLKSVRNKRGRLKNVNLVRRSRATDMAFMDPQLTTWKGLKYFCWFTYQSKLATQPKDPQMALNSRICRRPF